MNEENDRNRNGFGLIPQVALLFAIGILVTGMIALLTQRAQSNAAIKAETEYFAEEMARDVSLSVGEYPASDWLLSYWHRHTDDLDIEYDVSFDSGSKTEQKAALFAERHPDLQIRYVDRADLEAMPPEDQKLYAEIAYSWLITRVNQIKWSHDADFLFCVLTDDDFDTQFFLFSAADFGAKRGTNYEEVYPLGVTVDVSWTQAEAMRSAVSEKGHLGAAGKYLDYYEYMGDIDGMHALIGITYDLRDLMMDIGAETGSSTAWAMLYQFILSVLCLLLIFAFVLRPLRKVQHNIRLYRDNKDSETVIKNLSEIRTHNEIGQLSEDVISLAQEMDDHVKNIAAISAEKERIGTELDLAFRIQESMLPHDYPAFPDRHEFDIYATMDPAKEVGGDFYDYYLVDDDHLCIVMADVSGKGVPAALFMMASKIILFDNAATGKSPAQILTDANALICANNPEDMFVTVWLGILELSTGKLVAVNAGHEYPALRPPGGKFELLQDKHGLVVGAMEGIQYKEYELQLVPGSKIFLYTDGVPEAENAENEMFGTNGMIEALNRNGHADPVETIKNVKAAVDGFVRDAEQFDDLTVLCLEYNGPQKGSHDVFEIEAVKDNLHEITEFLETRLDAAGCPAKTVALIDLAVEEIFVNIAKYAYAPGTGKVRIGIDISRAAEEVMISFADKGTPYNPLEKEDPNVHLSADERPIGGLGIYLVKETMDSVTYVRDGDENILTIKKKF